MRSVVVLAVMVAAASAWLGTSAVAGGRSATCAQPYAPLYVESYGPLETKQDYPDHPVARPSIDGREVDAARSSFDMDGDGQADRLTTSPGIGKAATIVRADGSVQLTDPGRRVQLASYVAPYVGDLDGDGRDEVVVESYGDTTDMDIDVFLLPGATDVGAHALRDVAIALGKETDETSTGIRLDPWIGDQVGGPGDDALVAIGGHGRLVEGADLLAVGPGGSDVDFDGGTDFAGSPQALLPLQAGAPTLVLQDLATKGDVTLWRRGQEVRLRNGWVSGARFTMVEGDGTRYLVARWTDRFVGTTVVWDLDDPCRSLLPASQGDGAGGAEPATPVTADPGFTG